MTVLCMTSNDLEPLQPPEPEPESSGTGPHHLPSLPRYARWIRDTALFLIGAFIAIHETVQDGEPRALLLGLAAAAMGLPVFLRKDGK